MFEAPFICIPPKPQALQGRRRKRFRHKEQPVTIHDAEFFTPEDWRDWTVCWHPNPTINKRGWGSAKQVPAIHYLAVDIDDKAKQGRRLRTQDVLDACGEFAPCAVVETSPGSFHVYWYVRAAKLSRMEAERLNRELAVLLGGDPSAVNVNRILRIPGSINSAYGSEFVARQTFQRRHDYSRAELERLIGGIAAMPKPEHPGVAATSALPIVTTPELRVVLDTLAAQHDTEAYLKALSELYPRRASYRHVLALYVARDLYCQGFDEGRACAALKRLCAEASDPEVDDRLECVKSTYRRAELGLTTTGTGGGTVIRTAYAIDRENYLGNGVHLPMKNREAIIVDACARASIKHLEYSGKLPSQRTLAELVGITQKTVWKYAKRIRARITELQAGRQQPEASSEKPQQKTPPLVPDVAPIRTRPTPVTEEEIWRIGRMRERHKEQRANWRGVRFPLRTPYAPPRTRPTLC